MFYHQIYNFLGFNNIVKNIEDLIKNAIDIHFHIGPEVIPRKYNRIEDLIKNQAGKIKGIVLKNHFYPTSPFLKQTYNNKPILIGSVTLNNFSGGLNPESIYAASIISKRPIIVWFPTIDASNFLRKSDYEIPWEWVQKKEFKARLSKNIRGINILNKNKELTPQTKKILTAIKKTNAILATGHISWQESKVLADRALDMGIKKIIITHPIYQRINMPVKEQRKLARKGCFIEICYSMYYIDKIPMKGIASQIKIIGYKNIVLSSDVGQSFSPSPSQVLKEFGMLLIKEGITLNMLEYMMVKNPSEVVSI